MENLPLVGASIFGVLIFMVLGLHVYFKDQLKTTEDIVTSILASSITSFIFFTIIYAFLSFSFFLWSPFFGV